MKSFRKILAFVLALQACLPSFAQTSTRVISFGSKPLVNVEYGWNMGSGSQTEASAIANAGGKVARIGSTQWAQFENQSAPPNNTGGTYSLKGNALADVQHAAAAGLTIVPLAAYTPPFRGILTVITTADVPAGSSTIPVSYVSGVGGDTLSNLAPWYDYVSFSSTLNDSNVAREGTNTANSSGTGATTTSGFSYAGFVLDGVSVAGPTSTATLHLANQMAAGSDLPSGTTITINETLYPSPLTGVVANEPSIRAYAAYAAALGAAVHAEQMKSIYDAAYARAGAGKREARVELWNEPSWGGEFWDVRADAYVNDPGFAGELPFNGANYGFVDAIQNLPVVSGVNYVWSGPEVAGGAAGLLFGNPTRMSVYTGHAFTNPNPQGFTESIHPYGNNPEDNVWSQDCLIALPTSTVCNALTQSTSNSYYLAQYNLLNAPGAPVSITETGVSVNPNTGVSQSQAQSAKFDMRQFFGFAPGVAFMTAYRLYDTGDLKKGNGPGFSWITLTQGGTPCGLNCTAADGFTPFQSYTSMALFWSNVAAMNNAPTGTVTVPVVTSYSGTYDLGLSNFYGGVAGSSTPGYFTAVWQLSHSAGGQCAGAGGANCWSTVASPAPANLLLSIPPGTHFASAVNYTTGATVPGTVSGSTVALAVTDDPVGVTFAPTGTASPVTTPFSKQMTGAASELGTISKMTDPEKLMLLAVFGWIL